MKPRPRGPSLWSTGGRGSAVLASWCAAQVLSWSWAIIATRALGASLESRPEGALALLREGGRLAMDFAALQQSALKLFGEATGVLVALWALAWVFLGAAFVAMGTAPVAPTLVRALTEAARRFKTVLAIEAMGLLGAGTAGFLGWYGASHLARVDSGLLDTRRADLRQATAVLVAVLLFGLVRVWRDVAMAFVTGDGRRALVAAGDALAALARQPLATLGRALGWAALGWLPTAVLALSTVYWEWREGAAVVVLAAGAQQVASWWGYHCRMKWFVHLGERVVRRG